METINDKITIQYYIEKYHIRDHFTVDMLPFMTLHQYEKNEEILIAGEPLDYFYFIVEGKAKIFTRTENGKSVLLRFTRPLSELGSLELLHKNRHVNTCITAQFPTRVIRIAFNDLEKHALHDPVFLKYIVSRLSHKLETESNKSSLNSTYPFKNRLASYLISITEMKGERIDEIRIDKMTELATYLGTSYRHLTRVVKELEAEAIIKRTHKKFVILNYKALENLSGGYYE